jgi:endonuclease III
MKKAERYEKVIRYFSEHKPFAETELKYQSPFELAVAVLLSAQCTDKRVNLTTPAFFRKFPDAKALSVGTPEEVFDLIKSVTFPNNKTKSLLGLARTLMERYNGILPSDVEELMKLPGIGRKSANVLAAVVFNKPTMAVDTHVFRVAARIGLTTNAKTPLQTEMQLVAHIPENLIPLAHHWLILHGRYVCIARKPKCAECGLTSFCKYYEQTVAHA